MIKPRVSRVVFSTGIAPSESEYFDEINAYKKKALWILLLFVTRTMIPAAGGVQMTYYTIINDVQGICFIPELKNNNWTYQEVLTVTTTYGPELTERLKRCEYFDLDYATFANVSFQDALKLKKEAGLRKVKTCHEGDILLSTHSSKYHTVDTPFCYAKEIAKRMLIMNTGPHIICAVFFGILGDLFGRKKVASVATILWSTCSMCLAVLPSIGILQLFFFAASCGFQVAASLLTYVNLVEICHKKIRFFTVLTLYGYTLGFLVCTRFADLLNFSWTYLQYISFSFTVCALFHCFYIPESPRWLINKSRYREALKVMEEIIGYIPNEILFEDEGSETPFSCRIFWDMMRYLRKRKIKIVVILTLINAIIGFVNKTQVWRIMQSEVPLKTTVVASASDLLSVPYALIVYAALGKKYGLFWAFLSMNFTSFVTLCLQDTMPIDIYANAILILNAVTAQKFLFSYLPDLLPTFLRCTGLGIAISMYALMETITVAFIDWEMAKQNYVYLIFLIFSLPGFFILKLPDTTHADLPTVRLFRI
ncbi:solute carrier family 22 member 16-like [Coccinella septempunctata]|uniref:solute carrier family 22 member 16-like n=1 Tax=Coccinella septempunctata TaxID=41139 RepID=UPI001D0819A2|nr:solute carrier family 22 member 16-like [Coccinella septempunctata]